jgi:ubiquinone/menaquinone biosynthesis C-methylase UbiE
MTQNKKILDVCCGSRMCWFDKNNQDVIFNDIRDCDYTLCDGRQLHIHPDTHFDFRNLPWPNNSFKLVLFDPPHLRRVGDKSWMIKKYGRLDIDWKSQIKQGFNECMRVLETDGILIFKWNEKQISLKRVLECINIKPLFGHTTGRSGATKWMCFIKKGGEA